MFLALKTKLVVKAGFLAMSVGAAALHPAPTDMPRLAPSTVMLSDITYEYRASGDYQRDGEPADAPLQRRHLDRLEIMRNLVSATDYATCVADDVCVPVQDLTGGSPFMPVTKVSWQDAQAYARWLSTRTGDFWRLPTDAEWAAAAGSRYKDDAIRLPGGSSPSDRWLAAYEAETADRGDGAVLPGGAAGANENGVQDLAGSVWEWTDTCFTRAIVTDTETTPGAVNCGVRVVEGAHRSYVTNFIRDARAGGCAVGKPPSHLGIRLVRETRPLGRHFVNFADKVGLR